MRDLLVDEESMLSAGDGAVECARATEGLALGGRIMFFLPVNADAGRTKPAIGLVEHVGANERFGSVVL